EFNLDAQGTKRVIPDYFLFHRGAANYPRLDQATWIYSQMIRWGQTTFSDEGMEKARCAYRPDIYSNALGRDAAIPEELHAGTGSGYDGFMDGQIFNPDNVSSYVERFAVRSNASTASQTAET
ncbi:MAG: hypothetical protein RLZZ444_1382, partial [Pseudomonadota bacterium]